MKDGIAGRVVIDGRPLQGPSATRGIGTYARGLIAGLVNEGWGPRLGILVDAASPPPALPAEAGLVAYAVHRRYHGRFAPWEDAVALGRDLARIRPALYHAITLSLPGGAGCPVVATVHDLIPWAWTGGRAAMRGERLRYAFGRRRLAAADAVIAVSEATAADARRLAGVRADRIHVIPEAPDPGLRRVERPSGRWRAGGRPYLAFVGALDRRKDPDALVAAWRAAVAAGADCDLVVAGPPSAQAPAQLPGARFAGQLSRPALADFLSDAACLVFPSRYEGFGLPVLEAMACGCPVVAYANSSIPEVAGDAAELVPDGDPRALGEAAAAIVVDTDLRDRLRRRGLARVKRFSWAAAAQKTADVYQALVPGGLR